MTWKAFASVVSTSVKILRFNEGNALKYVKSDGVSHCMCKMNQVDLNSCPHSAVAGECDTRRVMSEPVT